MDLNNSNRESFDKNLLNPLIGLNLSNLGCIGFVVTFHPTCRILAKIPTTTPATKNGAKSSMILSKNTCKKEPTADPLISFALFLTNSGIFVYVKVNISKKPLYRKDINILSSKKRSIKSNALFNSLLLATLPSFLASLNFLAVGSSVFSPPGPSLANH